jgi:hypothetical protein
MVEPIPQWDPARLREIGIIFCVMAVAVLTTHHIPDLKQNARLRFLLTGSIVVTTFGGMNQYPAVTDLLTILVAAGAVVIPVAVCARAYWILVTTN